MSLKARIQDPLPPAYHQLVRAVKIWLARNDLNRLATILNTDKWGSHWYTQHYERYCASLRNKRLNILEIGVGDGGSLHMWKMYFRKSRIVGLDLYDKSRFRERRIDTRQADQSDTEALTRLSDEYGGFDLVIDDGSHLNEHIIKTFKTLFPLLRPHGIYFVEDTQTAYWPSWGGGIGNPLSSVAFFKGLADGLNYVEFPIKNYQPTYFDKNIIEIAFFHNLIVVQKGANEEKQNTPDTLSHELCATTGIAATNDRVDSGRDETAMRSNVFSGKEADDHRDSSIRAIAFNLPQFHPIPENDEWWGKGFTEWTNVVKARPRFKGHYQPHLPADLGFYDLRLSEARAAQAELAAECGIYGFCYYHYWFNGRQLLERPVNEIWRSGEPDLPFCLCWANENWTRRWDGQDSDVLVEQRYSLADDLAHIRALIPLFSDRRYIRVMNRPLFLVYCASKLPAPQKTTELWRREAERAGVRGLFLARVESFTTEYDDPRKAGFDCSVEFQPRWSSLSNRIYHRKWWRRKRLGTAEQPLFDNFVYDYEQLAKNALAEPLPAYPRLPCVCPGWDNSPRRSREATIFINSTPEKYECWLREVTNRTKGLVNRSADSSISPDSLIFINAWNEWAEGNHLEPCQRWGRAYLEATKRALGTQTGKTLEYAKS